MNIKSKDRILVVAPHPDDESIGMGGVLALYKRQCDVLLLTDGRHGHSSNIDIDENKLIDKRKEEIKKAVEYANIKTLFMLEIEDRMVNANKKKLAQFNIKDYDYIFVPNRYESDIDHKVVYPIVKKMIKKQKAKAKLYEYEVWTTLRCPTDYIDITPVIEIKRKMICCHNSQLEDCDYGEKGIALSNYRGMYAHCNYAEAVTDSSCMIKCELKQKIPLEVIEFIRKIKKKVGK